MKLYLVQHANPVAKEVDPERPLSERGRDDLRKIASFIKPLGLGVDCLWHSGKKRAEQTAELLAEVVCVYQSHSQHDDLNPNDDVTIVKDEIISADKNIMIVGHMPFLGKLTSLLLGGGISFKQGGVVCLNFSEDSKWQVEWMVTPGLIC